MFDLNEIIAKYNPDLRVLADTLFPNAKFAKMALDRVIKYQALLDTDQVIALAEFLNVPASSLFSESSNLTSEKINGRIELTKGNVKVVLFENSFYYSVYKNNKLIEQVVDDGSRITTDELFNKINTLI